MKLLSFVIAILALSVTMSAQSGRRAVKVQPPPPPAPETESKPKSPPDQAPPVTAERNQDYRCTDDGTLARILDPDEADERIVSSRHSDTRVMITARPAPSYTKEARRIGVQGFVVLKVLLAHDGKVSRVRIVKGLPAGLTENAIRAGCKIKFKPAMKDGQTVSQWITVEYVFRLADSSIFGP